MKPLIAAFLGLLLLTGPVRAMDNPMRQTIMAQLDAFQIDDFETAFTYASPNIRAIFRDAERFGSMVRNGYPMVWRPMAVQFGSDRMENGRRVQIVYLTDQQGRIFEAAYEMIDAGGTWQINGVAIREADLGA